MPPKTPNPLKADPWGMKEEGIKTPQLNSKGQQKRFKKQISKVLNVHKEDNRPNNQNSKSMKDTNKRLAELNKTIQNMNIQHRIETEFIKRY